MVTEIEGSAPEELAYILRMEEQEEKRAEGMKLFLAECEDKLRERVRNGETTGNPIADYFLKFYGCANKAAMLPLQKLQAQMEGKEAQLFLVLQREEKVEKYFAGKLSGEKLVFDGDRYGFPTDGYYSSVSFLGWWGWRCGLYLFPAKKGPHASNEIIVASGVRPEFEVVIGDEEVSKLCPGGLLLKRVFQALGK